MIRKEFEDQYYTIFNAAITTLEHLGINIRSQDKNLGEIVGTKGLPLLSMGENISIHIKNEYDHTLLEIESKSLNLLIPWDGKEKKEKRFLGELNNLLSKR